jgi:hypothetical protein
MIGQAESAKQLVCPDESCSTLFEPDTATPVGYWRSKDGSLGRSFTTLSVSPDVLGLE